MQGRCLQCRYPCLRFGPVVGLEQTRQRRAVVQGMLFPKPDSLPHVLSAVPSLLLRSIGPYPLDPWGWLVLLQPVLLQHPLLVLFLALLLSFLFAALGG